MLSTVGLRNPLVCRFSRRPPLKTARLQCKVMAVSAHPRPVILLDIMDTVVYDPFFHDMPVFFEMSFKELLAAKHPSAWVEFECGIINEDQLLGKFFEDGRNVDGVGLKAMMVSKYRYLDGMESLLKRLKLARYDMRACSNYPEWFRLIEDKLRPSEYLQWTFVSCEGPMKGFRKPAAEAFEVCIHTLQRHPQEIIFVDDRKVNVEAACASGLDGIHFEHAEQLEAELLSRGLVF